MTVRYISRAFGCHFYFSLWCLYWLQGTLFPIGGIISQSILALLLAISFYYFTIAHFRYQLPSVMKTITLMVLIFVGYGLLSLVSGETFIIKESGVSGVTAMGYIKNVLISFLPVYYVYVATKEQKLSENSLRIWTIVFLLVAIICFYSSQTYSILESGRDEVTNNSAYSILAIIVLIPLFDKKLFIQFAILSICMFYVLIGMKRGALVCGAVATVWFLLNTILSKGGKRNGIWVFLLTAAIVFAALYAVSFMLDNSDYFNTRLESTLESGIGNRDEIYRILFNHFVSEKSLFHFMLGNGANATLRISMNYAHNDWLEMAIDNGMVMIAIYFVYWVRMFNTIKHSKKDKTIYMMLSTFFIIYFLKSFFSMSYSDIPTWASTAFGFSLAKCFSVEEKRNACV